MLVFHHSTCIEPFSLPMKSDFVMLSFKISSESLQKVFRFKCEHWFQHIFHWIRIKWSLESASLGSRCSRNKSWRVGSMRCPDGLKNHKLMNHANKQTRHFSDSWRFMNLKIQDFQSGKLDQRNPSCWLSFRREVQFTFIFMAKQISFYPRNEKSRSKYQNSFCWT